MINMEDLANWSLAAMKARAEYEYAELALVLSLTPKQKTLFDEARLKANEFNLIWHRDSARIANAALTLNPND